MNLLFEIIESYHDMIQEICLSESLNLLQIGNLAEFDALVGETSCQIRAVKIASIYKKNRYISSQFIDKNDLEFLLLSRFLTQSREIVKGNAGQLISHKINSKLLSKTISNRQLRRLVTYAQKRLAHLSVSFLQEIAYRKNDIELIKAVNYVLIDDEIHHQRKNCSAYSGMKTLIHHIQKERFDVLIRIYDTNPSSKNCFLDLLYKKNQDKYIYCPINEISHDEPIIVFEGCSNLRDSHAEYLKNKLIKYNIFDVILAFFASHDQFIGKNIKYDLPYQDLNLSELFTEKNRHLNFASLEGCILDNKNLLFLTHVYTTIKFFLE